MSEIIEATELKSDRRKGQAFLSRLVDLPLEEREREVGRLAEQARKLRGREVGLFSLESLEDIGPITDLIVGAAAPPFFAMRNLVRRILKLRNRSIAFDQIIDAMEQDLTPSKFRNEDLDFLSKVDRVAQIRRNKIS